MAEIFILDRYWRYSMQTEKVRAGEITNGTLSKYKGKRRRGKTEQSAETETENFVLYIVHDRSRRRSTCRKQKKKKKTTKLLSFSKRRCNLRQRKKKKKNRQTANWESTFNDRRSSRWSSFVSNETKPFDTEWSSHVISSLYDVH